MLIRFKLANFMSFGTKQEIVMIPSKKVRKREEHLVNAGAMSLLRLATFYGANASGKSNLVEAIRFSKYVVTRKIPTNSKRFYCRLFDSSLKKDSYYAYGFNINLHEGEIVSEWLYELFPETTKQKMIFERIVASEVIDLGEDLNLSDNEKSRFETYRHDFAGDKSSLF
jgi:AAA15 family ATPase/GTPase